MKTLKSKWYIVTLTMQCNLDRHRKDFHYCYLQNKGDDPSVLVPNSKSDLLVDDRPVDSRNKYMNAYQTSLPCKSMLIKEKVLYTFC